MIKTAEEIREQFELETGKNWVTIPVSHGELGFASWEYQLWLENKVAQFIQPQKVDSGNVWRWVKASEDGKLNLPHTFFASDEMGDGSETLSIRLNGIPYVGRYIKECGVTKNCFVVAGVGFYSEKDFDQIEWLEPLPQGEGYSVEDEQC